MNYIVKKQFKGSPNGRDVINFDVGGIFDPVKMGEELTAAAIKDGSIEKRQPTERKIMKMAAKFKQVKSAKK